MTNKGRGQAMGDLPHTVGKNSATEAYWTLRRFIEAERGMRQTVFRNDPAKQARKVKEAEDALAALDVLAALLHQQEVTTPAAQQASLDFMEPTS